MTEYCDYVTLPQLIERRPYLTERWIRSLVASGTLKRRKLGGRLIFVLSEIDALVEASVGSADD